MLFEDVPYVAGPSVLVPPVSAGVQEERMRVLPVSYSLPCQRFSDSPDLDPELSSRTSGTPYGSAWPWGNQCCSETVPALQETLSTVGDKSVIQQSNKRQHTWGLVNSAGVGAGCLGLAPTCLIVLLHPSFSSSVKWE